MEKYWEKNWERYKEKYGEYMRIIKNKHTIFLLCVYVKGPNL